MDGSIHLSLVKIRDFDGSPIFNLTWTPSVKPPEAIAKKLGLFGDGTKSNVYCHKKIDSLKKLLQEKERSKKFLEKK